MKTEILDRTKVLWRREVQDEFPLVSRLPFSRAQLFIQFAKGSSQDELIALGASRIASGLGLSEIAKPSAIEVAWSDYLVEHSQDWPFLPLWLKKVTGRRILAIHSTGGDSDPRWRKALEEGFELSQFENIENEKPPSRAILRQWVKNAMSPEFELISPRASENWTLRSVERSNLRLEVVFGPSHAPLITSFLLTDPFNSVIQIAPACESVLGCDVIWDQLVMTDSVRFAQAIGMIKRSARFIAGISQP